MTEYIYRAHASPSLAGFAEGTFSWRVRGVARRMASASVFLLWVVIFLLSWAPQAAGREETLSEVKPIEMSVGEHLYVESSSAAKMAQEATDAATAIYVLTEKETGN